MKSNLFTGFLLSISLLPSLLFAQESEFVEDRSSSMVEVVEANQKQTESTAAVVQDYDVKKSDVGSSMNWILGAHLESSLALPLDMKMAADVQNNSEEANATWIGAKFGVGVGVGFYFNPKMALVTGFDFQLLNFSTVDRVPRNRVTRVVGTESYGYGRMDIRETQVRKTSPQYRSIKYYQVASPVSFRYHFLEDLWGQLGVCLNQAMYTNESGLYENYFEEVSSGIVYNEYPLPSGAKREFIPSLLLSAGKSWTAGKLIFDVALSFSYALKKSDFDYGLSANTFTIGIDFYAWFSLTKEKK